MYKVNVLTSGKYDNVVLGERFYLFKKRAQEAVKMFEEVECKYSVSKFTRMHFGAYCWSEVEVILSDFFNVL